VPNTLHGITELCAQVESVDANLKEMDTRIRKLRIDTAAMALGVELHQKRGQLTKQWEHFEKQRDDLTQQIQMLEGELKELKGEETKQTVLASHCRIFLGTPAELNSAKSALGTMIESKK
jgi:chromosome segregation ATPase